ncbi:MAG: MotA/TolQ/ExbB proton channel family protein [Pedosphaera sp.]|nr:MotA/TolQ/ExbB proton channel family protein [Pedosphaera sp.]
MEQFIFITLIIASILSLTFIIERGLALRWTHVIPPAVEQAQESCKTLGQIDNLRAVCQSHPSPLSNLLLTAANHLDRPREETIDALQTRARKEVVRLERGLVLLEIVTGIAPLLGLVGTVMGLIKLFGAMSSATGDQGKFAEGISVALNATLMGLIIAIPSLVAWSYYNKKVETLTVEMETHCDEFIRRQYRQMEH